MTQPNPSPNRERRSREAIYVIALRHWLVPILVFAYGISVFVIGVCHGEGGLHWPHQHLRPYRATRDLPINTRLEAIDVKHPESDFSSQFWSVPDFERQMKGRYTTEAIRAGAEIDPGSLASVPHVQADVRMIALEDAKGWSSFLNAGSQIRVCDSTKTCTSSVHTVEAVYCDASKVPVCYAAVDTAGDPKDIPVLENHDLRIIPVKF
ncbi:hypothetical protein [Pararobbsia silviterrae]|uniref:Uncharacterized protein n=1 Tax=Pararobbsia silviterrae TaxID=1792498 RepID=A0A494X9D2_9BURK|nr:hypothetical protein [Pararobbsia silviterrae]RKP47070.1 hypothetical protein D7S86_23235 [Pararobbsia silviterrae]